MNNFLTGMPQRFEVAKNRVLLHGAVIEIDNASGIEPNFLPKRGAIKIRHRRICRISI